MPCLGFSPRRRGGLRLVGRWFASLAPGLGRLGRCCAAVEIAAVGPFGFWLLGRSRGGSVAARGGLPTCLRCRRTGGFAVVCQSVAVLPQDSDPGLSSRPGPLDCGARKKATHPWTRLAQPFADETQTVVARTARRCRAMRTGPWRWPMGTEPPVRCWSRGALRAERPGLRLRVTFVRWMARGGPNGLGPCLQASGDVF